MPILVKMHQAKSDLSRLVARAQAGEEVIIMRDELPEARLVPIHHERVPGLGQGKVRIAPDFNETLPEDLPQTFEPRSRAFQ